MRAIDRREIIPHCTDTARLQASSAAVYTPRCLPYATVLILSREMTEMRCEATQLAVAASLWQDIVT